MSTFKVGDTVRCIDPGPWYEEITMGNLYVIDKVDRDGDVYLTDRSHVYLKRRFELAQVPAGGEVPTVFKVGDKVRVVRKVENGTDEWTNVWARGMDTFVNDGDVYEVDRDVGSMGLRLKGAGYSWPAAALELVSSEPKEVIHGYAIRANGTMWGSTHATHEEAQARGVALLTHGQEFEVIKLASVGAFKVNKVQEALPV